MSLGSAWFNKFNSFLYRTSQSLVNSNKGI